MVRYLLAAAAVVALVSGPALAQDADAGSKTVITKTGPEGMTHKKVIIRRHGDRYGALVRHHFDRDRMYGSSMMRSHRMMGPEGRVVIKKRTVVRDRY